MKLIVGKRYLVTSKEWFYTPLGTRCEAVYGTVKATIKGQMALGMSANRDIPDEHLHIGNMTLSWDQVHSAIRSDACADYVPDRNVDIDGDLTYNDTTYSRIYFADEED